MMTGPKSLRCVAVVSMLLDFVRRKTGLAVLCVISVVVFFSWNRHIVTMEVEPKRQRFVSFSILHRETEDDEPNFVRNVPEAEDIEPSCPKEIDDTKLPEYPFKPLIQLDPTRFLYTAVVNGPSNELIALQETLFIAIQTNRTVVVPNFYLHFANHDEGNNHGKEVPAKMRIDVDMLAQFVSLASVEQMKSRCNSRFDVGFQMRVTPCSFEKHVKKSIGMSMDSPHKSLLLKGRYGLMRFRDRESCVPPALPVLDVTSRQTVAYSKIKQKYRSEFPCVMLINNFKKIPVPIQNLDEKLIEAVRVDPSSLKAHDIKSCSKETLIKLIETFTQKPKHIRGIATAFIREVMEQRQFAAFHWRYNAEWRITFCKPEEKKWWFCDLLDKTGPRLVAASLISLAKNLTEALDNSVFDGNCQSPYAASVYFATAFSDHESVKNISMDQDFQNGVIEADLTADGRIEDSKMFSNMGCWKARIYTTEDLRHFLDARFSQTACPSIWYDGHELISLLENEICRMSTVFAYSILSSWSRVALQARPRFYKFETDISLWEIVSRVSAFTKE